MELCYAKMGYKNFEKGPGILTCVFMVFMIGSSSLDRSPNVAHDLFRHGIVCREDSLKLDAHGEDVMQCCMDIHSPG